ncbi:toll-like receptor 5 [Sceloporus undulatus]|uniref:toll-like receptor 5 n=1 Tax=Sceloporus undulatus TaxID=8520 RepID=UPI001C4C456E|nr:toll-like receptor 5 [Sceloporus undulatus]
MLRIHQRWPALEAQKVRFGLVMLLLAGRAADALPRCSQYTVNALQVANCQAQRHKMLPDLDPSVQVLLLNFNFFSSILNSSFPLMKSLKALSLGKQLGGSLFVGERAFQNVTNITFLDLGGNRNLTLHPNAFKGLTKLEVLLLDADGFNEEVLEKGYFQDLVSLKRLDLSGNNIRRLRPDPTFQGLKKLSILQLKLNKIGAICGDDLQHLRGHRLDTLDLSSNRLLSYPYCGNPFLNITLGTLDISSNSWNVDKAERFFTRLNGTRIQNLKMQYSGALGRGFGFHNSKDISASTFSGLRHSSIFSLDISHGFLNELVSLAFLAFPDLNVLLLRSNQITKIHDRAFAGLNQLSVLDLSENLLGELYEESLRALRSSLLQHLILKSNHIGAVQNGALAGLNSLQILDLQDNALSRVPAGNLPSLLHLTLRQNRIRDVWGIERLGKSLAHLDLSSNRLDDLGGLWSQLAGTPNLLSLNLSSNGLSRCYRVGEGPRRLQALDLSHNSLGNIWEMEKCVNIFQGLAELAVLNLSSNGLRSLPERLLQPLRSLQMLNLSNNLFPVLPKRVFYGLASLRVLSLSGNPLVTLSPSPFLPLEGLRSLDLSRLSLLCDCGLVDLQGWIQERKIVLSGAEAMLSCLQTRPSFQRFSLPSFLKDQCAK